MITARLVRQLAFGAGAATFVGLGVLTACSRDEAPVEPPTPSSSQVAPASVSPTEKGVPAAGVPGASSFSPTVKARPAPTALPGNIITGG